MKKVLFAAALAATFGIFADGIESSNIVGYTQKEQMSGAYSKCVCFDGIGTSAAMDIQNIIPQMPEGEELYSGCFQIMTLTDATETEATYMYLTAEDAELADGVAAAGWFTDDFATRLTGDNAVVFEPGEGFLVISDLDDATITFAGQVGDADTITPLHAGANFCGNNALAALDIQDVEVGTICTEGVISNDEDLYSGAFQIMTLTSSTETEATYMYLTAEDAEIADGDATPGWFTDDFATRLTGDNSVAFALGEGFLVMTDFDEAFVKVPGNKLPTDAE